jgi:hypothetical protein
MFLCRREVSEPAGCGGETGRDFFLFILLAFENPNQYYSPRFPQMG